MIDLPIIIYFYWVLLASLLLYYKNIKDYKYTLVLCIISFFILLISYNGTNSDWKTYRGYMEKATYPGATYFEKGFDFLLYIGNFFNCFEIIPIFAIVIFFSLCLIIKKLKLYSHIDYFILIFSLYLGFLPLYFGAIRQSIASCFILFSIYYCIENRKLYASFYVLLSYFFHKSSLLIIGIIIFFYIYLFFLQKMHLRHKFLVTVIIVAGMFIIAKVTIEPVFNKFGIGYRLGNTDNYTSNPLKDLFILAERVAYIYFFYIMFMESEKSRNIDYHISVIGLVGTFFYIVFYSLARNLAGRTLAFFRFFDIYVMYKALNVIIPTLFLGRRSSRDYHRHNNIAMFVTLFYAVLKYEITVASSGVF